jgi:hypothetical protein
MPEYCCDKARAELNLMLAGGCAAGIAPIPGAMTVGLTAVQTGGKVAKLQRGAI